MGDTNMIVLASITSAAATAVIAWFAWQTQWMARRASARDSEFRQQLSDLTRAIAIATLMATAQWNSHEIAMKKFEQYYEGASIFVSPEAAKEAPIGSPGIAILAAIVLVVIGMVIGITLF